MATHALARKNVIHLPAKGTLFGCNTPDMRAIVIQYSAIPCQCGRKINFQFWAWGGCRLSPTSWSGAGRRCPSPRAKETADSSGCWSLLCEIRWCCECAWKHRLSIHLQWSLVTRDAGFSAATQKKPWLLPDERKPGRRLPIAPVRMLPYKLN